MTHSPRLARAPALLLALALGAPIAAVRADAVPEPAECDNPVGAHVEAGDRVGVKGTPTLVTETGDLIGGYVPYAELLRRFERG